MELSEPHTTADAQAEPRCVRVLRRAWARYWSDVDLLWRPILEAFQRGDRNAYDDIKDDCSQTGVHHVMSANLCAIRAALRGVGCACERGEEGLNGKKALFDALLLMVRPGKYPPGEGSAKFSWQCIRSLFSEGSQANGAGPDVIVQRGGAISARG